MTEGEKGWRAISFDHHDQQAPGYRNPAQHQRITMLSLNLIC